MKPFGGTLRVTKPVRKSLASNRKRVLRGVGVTRPAVVTRGEGRSESRVFPWYRQAKATKRGGRSGRKS